MKTQFKKTYMRLILRLIAIIFSNLLFGQQTGDYVILKPQNDSAKPDTIYGQIDLPQNGILLNVKIITDKGKEKYKIKETIGFKAGEVYFASLVYNKGYVFAPRLIEGPIDLYLYYSGNDGYTYLFTSGNLREDLISNAIGAAYSAVAVSITSYYYIHDLKTDKYFRVPHSGNKFIEKLSDIFKGNTEIYKKILNGEYKPNQIAEIVELYNKSMSRL